MYPAHAAGERVLAEEQHTTGRNRRTFPRRRLWCYRIFFLLVLVLFGLHLLSAGSSTVSGASLTGHESPSDQTGLVSGEGYPVQIGLGAGATSSGMTNASTPVATCLNPLDATCWLQMLLSGWRSKS
jgi:hypothetical protein